MSPDIHFPTPYGLPAGARRYLEKLPTAAARTSTVVGGIKSVVEVPEIVTVAEPVNGNGSGMGWVPPLPVPAVDRVKVTAPAKR